jgi:acetyltransferase-like isoleucine patch superfamily enzyme
MLRRAVIEAESALLGAIHPGSFGPGLRVFGWPIVTVAPGSLLHCGRRLSLVSDPVYSATGIAHPCILRTLRPQARLIMGDDVGLSGATVCCAERVEIGDRVLVGANVTITDTDFHALRPEGRRWSGASADAAPVAVGDDVFLGMGSVVLKGVTIGRDAVVGALSVVTRDVPAGAVVAGAPAVVVGAVPGYDVARSRSENDADGGDGA